MLTRCPRLLPFTRPFSTIVQKQHQEDLKRWQAGIPYTLTRPIEYTKGMYVVFQQNLEGVRQMPHEIKETAVKNTLGVATFGLLSFAHPILSVPIPFFVLNMFIRSLRYMLRAVNKIELLEGGHTVRLTKRTGRSFEVPITSIRKKEDEATLMKTYLEPYLFPIEVMNSENQYSTYYIYGRNFEPIVNGEAFRAIINGKPILNPTSSSSPPS